jgi:hypothetical protein
LGFSSGISTEASLGNPPVQANPQPFQNRKAFEQRTLRQATSDEASRGMADEGCPNEPGSSVRDATEHSGADDAVAQQ